jgi:hypothetical protein
MKFLKGLLCFAALLSYLKNIVISSTHYSPWINYGEPSGRSRPGLAGDNNQKII